MYYQTYLTGIFETAIKEKNFKLTDELTPFLSDTDRSRVHELDFFSHL